MVQWQWAFAAGYLVALAARAYCKQPVYPWTPAPFVWGGVFCFWNWVLG